MTLVLLGSLLLAAVFSTAGVTKLRDLSGSRQAMQGFGVPAPLVAPLGVAVPLAELAVALALLVGSARVWGALGALTLLAGFSLAIAWNLAHGRTPDCHCFGQLHSSPAGPRTLARNAGLIALAGFVASQADPVWTAIAASGGVAVAVTGWALSRRAKPARSDDAPTGLAIGSVAPSFALPALEGCTVSLEGLLGLGKPALLVFSDPHCGPCQAMAPEIAEWQRLHSDELTIAVIESRDGATAGESDEHGRRTVLLQSESEVTDSYGAQGTPTAVLVGSDGRVASAVAGGSVGIEALMAASVTRFEPHPVEVEGGSAWTVPVRLGGPMIRRELLARGAAASAAASTVLAWPVRAVGKGRAKGPPRCDKDKDCPDSTTCRSGRCRCGSFPGPDRCPGQCVNFDLDLQHCGGCNKPCPEGTLCRGGNCRAGNDSTCVDCDLSDGLVCCQGGECASLLGDENCGGCGVVCGSGQTCCWGRCVDHSTDSRYCGGCLNGEKCAPNQVCHAGRCRDECPKPLRQCGRTCGRPSTQRCCGGKLIDKDDMQFDNDNCGDCGDKCRGQFDTCCSGVCQYLGFDGNCGACGVSCPPGFTCQGRECICLVTNPDGTCQGS